jgi:hypothetical protein
MTRVRRGIARAAALTFVATTSLVLMATAAGARSGTWGAAHSAYLDGLVCSAGIRTAPLAAWDFGTGAPAFLTRPVTSDGVTDSAALPFASPGPQDVSPVLPGDLGFTTASDIATYARLLDRFGTGPAGQVAGVARAVMVHTATDAPDCAGTADAAGLLDRAGAAAGPYSIAVTTTPRLVVPGTTATITATVTGGSGAPAPGIPVTFAATGLTLDGRPAVTDPAGQAHVSVTTPTGSGSSGPFDVTASVRAPVGLVRISTTTAPTATDPGGATAEAIAPAAPETVAAHGSVAVDPSADPTITAGFDAGAVAVGHPVIPHAVVHGLRGHTGTVDLTVLGPVPPDAHGQCGAATFDASSPAAYTTDPIATVGDRTVNGTPWTPEQPGCYAARAAVTTVDAVPEVTATSKAAGAALAVIAATLTLAPPHPVVGAGPATVVATAARVGDAGHRLWARLDGPVTPGAGGSCATVGWSGATRSARIDAVATGTQPATLQSAPMSTPGCYRWIATLLVDLDSTTVPVDAVSPGVLLVRPQLAVTSDRTWTVSPGAVAAHVSVTGTYGRPVHVSVQLRYAARPDTGCRAATWNQAPLSRPGTAYAVSAVGLPVAVESGPTSRTGCYLPVATLVLDANPAVTVTSTPAPADNAVLAGLGDQQRAALVTYRLRPTSSSPLLVTGAVVAIVQLVVIVAIVVVARAWHVRDERD